MQANFYETNAPRKPTNLSINADLLNHARALNLNLSQLLEQHLIEVVRERLRECWLEENREAVDDYNQRIERDGVFSDGLRRF